MKIKLLGAAGGVTGSAYLVETESHRFMVDFGMFQGEDSEKNFAPVDFNPETLDFVFLTHAHLDHCGRLPLLRKNGFRGHIFATHATIELASVVMRDSAHLQEEGILYENKREALYNSKDARRTIDSFKKVRFGEKVKFGSQLNAEFFVAGHILGAASIRFEITENGEKKLVTFSGDLGSGGQTVVPKPARIPKSDLVFMESTYGNRLHEQRDLAEAKLWKIIKKTIERGGKVIIPSFAIERTQEILELFDRWSRDRDFEMPIYLDSPMGRAATNIYKSHFVEFSGMTKRGYEADKSLLSFPNLKIISTHQKSMGIWEAKRCIVLSGSGMMTGGRVVGHLSKTLPDPKSTVIIIGYQAEGTRGREILEGAKSVWINEENIPVIAEIEVINGFSAHADQLDLLNWFSQINGAKKLILTHGEDESRKILKEKILGNRSNVEVLTPEFGEIIEF